jgi:hypothetical protein
VGLAENLAEVIASAGLSFRTNSRSYILDCPQCKREGRLYMFRDNGWFVCVGCVETSGFKGRPEYALTDLTGLSVKELKKRLYGDAGPQQARYLDFDLQALLDGDDAEVILPTPQAQSWPAHCYELEHKHAAKGRAYLDGRGVPWQIADTHYGVRYSPEMEALAFPVHVDTVLIGWQYRSVMPEFGVDADGERYRRLRYWTDPPAMPRNRAVMFSHRITSNIAVLGEGPFDALKAHLVGGNVNAMGKEVSDGQLRALACAGVEKVFVMVDPDAAASVEPLGQRILQHRMVPYEALVPKPYKDPGEMSMEQVPQAVSAAGPMKFGRIRMDLDLVASRLGIS